MVQIHAFLNLALDGGSSSDSRPRCFSLRPLNRRLGGPHSRSGCFWKEKRSFPLPQIESLFLVVQSVVWKLYRVTCPSFIIFVPWRNSPQWAKSSSLPRIHDHTQTHHTQTHHTQQDPSGRLISPTQRPLPDNTQHKRQTCPRRDSHPQSQQANGRRPKP